MTIMKRLLVFVVCCASFFVGIGYLAVRPSGWPEELCYIPVGVAFAWAIALSQKMKREKLLLDELMEEGAPAVGFYRGNP
jgi:hypothetical protein